MLFDPYSWFVFFDAKVQAVFDRFIFFFMRLGVSKAFIRYLVWSAMIMSMCVGALCDLAIDSFKVGLLTIVPSIVPLVMFIRFRRRHSRDDAIAEERGRASRADLVPGERLIVGKMIAWGAIMILVILMPTYHFVWTHSATRQVSLANFLNYLSFLGTVLSFFFILYLVKTPPTTPPAEIRQTSLAPAAAKQ